MAILIIGIFAALGQLQIAPGIGNGLLYALLAIIVGVAIVAFGGGGIRRLAGIGSARVTASRGRHRRSAGMPSGPRQSIAPGMSSAFQSWRRNCPTRHAREDVAPNSYSPADP
jgi:hypothetical protein